MIERRRDDENGNVEVLTRKWQCVLSNSAQETLQSLPAARNHWMPRSVAQVLTRNAAQS
jgi:hypothetical protein